MGKLFNFFSGTDNRSGKGVSKKQVEFDKKLGFGFFFRLLKMRLGKFSSSNLIFLLCNIFIVVALFGLAGILDSNTNAAANPLYAQINAIAKNQQGPEIATLYSVFCSSVSMRVISKTSRILMYTVFLLIFTFGLSTIGLVYNMRNVCTGEHIDTWSDYFYSIKKNFKQGIVLGILDAILIILLIYDIILYSAFTSAGFMYLVFFYASIFIAVIYYFMRFYMYIQLVTCEMSIGKMIKNALLLTALGFKRNFVALLGTIASVILFLYIYILLPQVAIVLIGMFAISFLTYIGVYAAYPVVKRYVIDPYYDEHPDERPEDPWASEEQVFIDRE